MRLRYSLMAMTLLLMASAEAAEPLAPPPALPETPEAIDLRIREIEAQLIEEQAKRFRAKHALEYGDTNIAPRYAEAKSLEKKLREKQTSLEEALRVEDEGIRKAESDIDTLWKQRVELEQLADAIRREMSSTGNTITNAQDKAALVGELGAELTLLTEQTKTLDDRIRQDREALERRKAEVMAAKPDLQALKGEVDQLKAEYQARFGELQETLDATEQVKQLDQRRLEWARELQLLRERRKAFAPAVPAAGNVP